MSDDTTDIIDAALEAELTAKWGPGLRAVRTAAGPVVLRRVKRDKYKHFLKMLHVDATKADALEYIARAACVHPDAVTLTGWLDDYPGIGTKMGNIALEMAKHELRKIPQLR